MDPMDHEAYGGHNDGFAKGRADEYQVADVVQLHPPGTFAKNTDSGDTLNAVAKALNIGPPANVIKYPRK